MATALMTRAGFSTGALVGLSLGVYLVISYLKVLAGSIYPSDALLSLPVCFLTLSIFELIIFTFVTIESSGLHLITRRNFVYYIKTYYSGFALELIIVAFSIMFVLVFMLHPITYWRKTPFWMSSALAFFIFDTIFLSPTQANDYYMQPERTDALPNYSPAMNVFLVTGVFIHFIFMVGVGDQLVGRRVGQCPSSF